MINVRFVWNIESYLFEDYHSFSPFYSIWSFANKWSSIVISSYSESKPTEALNFFFRRWKFQNSKFCIMISIEYTKIKSFYGSPVEKEKRVGWATTRRPILTIGQWQVRKFIDHVENEQPQTKKYFSHIGWPEFDMKPHGSWKTENIEIFRSSRKNSEYRIQSDSRDMQFWDENFSINNFQP